jgi:glycosyltransferase involved in cell wall biosynthesis
MSQRNLLTTVILTKNESSSVAELFSQAEKWSDQVIFLDDYSDDIKSLREMMQSSKGAIFQHALNGDYAAHRNSVLGEIASEWTLFLDADELPKPEFWEEVMEIIQKTSHDAFFLRRRNVFLGRELKYGEAGEKHLLRLARTSLGKNAWKRAVHERWEVPTDSMGTIQALVLHRQPESLKAFVEKLNRYAVLEGKARKKQTVSAVVFELFTYPLGKFLWNFIVKQGFRDGFPGFSLAFLMSYYSLIVRVLQYEKTL